MKSSVHSWLWRIHHGWARNKTSEHRMSRQWINRSLQVEIYKLEISFIVDAGEIFGRNGWLEAHSVQSKGIILISLCPRCTYWNSLCSLRKFPSLWGLCTRLLSRCVMFLPFVSRLSFWFYCGFPLLKEARHRTKEKLSLELLRTLEEIPVPDRCSLYISRSLT
jgi:hypothetical protein